MSDHPLFKVHAYVDETGVSTPRLTGWATVGQIWVHSPEVHGRLYAVVETAAREFQVVEFDPAVGAGYAFRKEALPPKWTGPSVDALVMKALALYDR